MLFLKKCDKIVLEMVLSSSWVAGVYLTHEYCMSEG